MRSFVTVFLRTRILGGMRGFPQGTPHPRYFSELQILRDFKSKDLELQILKGLQGRILELQVIKDLAAAAVESPLGPPRDK